MSNHRNVAIQKVALDQMNQITEQVKKNAPIELASTGDITVISEIPSAGYYITEKGTYVLGNDITWSPPVDGFLFAAIVIQCDNVVLDFKGHTLSINNPQNNGDYSSIGVIVLNSDYPTACSKVTVTNGTIKDMGVCGLWALKTNSLSVSKITINGLSNPNFSLLPSGISLWDAESFSVSDCIVQNIELTALLGSGIQILNSTTGSMSNCTVETFINHDGVASGYTYFKSSGIETINCTATNLNTFYAGNPDSIIGHTCIGFMMTACKSLIFSECSASVINGCCDDCHGMSLYWVKKAKVTNFTASHVHDGNGTQKTGAKATGLEVYGNDITISKCQVSDITAIVPQDRQSTGFSVCGTNITFDSCMATSVIALDADGLPDVSHGYGTGFGWAPDPRPSNVKPANGVTYKNCVANNCQLGFDTWSHQNSKWINPSTKGTTSSHLIQTPSTTRIFSMNFCSELPGSTPSSKAKQFTIHNQIEGSTNTYPDDWNNQQKD